MARKHLLAFLSFAAAVLLVGQGAVLAMTLPDEPEVEGEVGMTHGHIAPSDEPLASGRVVAVDRAASRITLEFRPIPQKFLEGGTRIFQVKEPASLQGLRPGDKVRFEVERDARTYIVTRLANSN
ncbi:MAG: copper-binding protein [Reyranellaceae bacterium]|jgi:Cu/Ag efflux protein CusF